MSGMTGSEFIKICKADLCLTQSRKRSGQKYHNKYTEYFGKLGYAGINKNGVFTKKYSYGVVGHCCIGVQYWLCRVGLSAFVPKATKSHYYWNTGVYRKYLKSQPNIKGYGKVKWVTDPAKAKAGAIAFTSSHTCVFIQYNKKTGKVQTVNFNVSDGKGHNNGVVKWVKKSKFIGFANMPYPETKPVAPVSPSYAKGKTYTLQVNLNVRADHKTSAKKLSQLELTENAQKSAVNGVLQKGTRVTCQDVYTTATMTWLKIPSGWICAKNGSKIYVK